MATIINLCDRQHSHRMLQRKYRDIFVSNQLPRYSHSSKYFNTYTWSFDSDTRILLVKDDFGTEFLNKVLDKAVRVTPTVVRVICLSCGVINRNDRLERCAGL